MGGESGVSTAVGAVGERTTARRAGSVDLTADGGDPYGEHPLLTSAMAEDYETVPAVERERLRRYLEAVVAVRRAPVHVAVAFNAVYFGYDLGGEGYGRSPLLLEDFPTVALGECVPALPVGAMVRIATGSDPLFAEIVYKEGAHPGIRALGDVPAWVSGAPAGAEGPGRPGPDQSPVRRELLVPDPDAFGPGLRLSPAQLQRLRTHQRWINEDGHVVVDACYPSGEEARRSDLVAHAEYLLTTARAQLMSPFVPVSLRELAGGEDDAELRRALLRLLNTVRRVLISSERLRMWGPYAVTRKSLAACWRDTGPLGGDDMRSLATAVERAAVPTRRRYGLAVPVTAYTAVGPRLRAFLGAGESLRGVNYAAAVCRANLTLADVVRRDSELGLFANGARIGLDDAFEGGGVWRSHFPGDAEAATDPMFPAGRGWASTTPSPSSPEPVLEPVLEPVDPPLADGEALGRCELMRSGGAEVVWRLPLRLAHLIDGCLPLHPLVIDELRQTYGSKPVLRAELIHPGGTLEEGEAVQHVEAELGEGGGRLTEVAWPTDFFPGLLIEVRWTRGSQVFRISTAPLGHRVRVGDRTTGHSYDPLVLTREDVPGSDRSGDSPAGLSSRQLVMRVVRRCGLLTPDGHALLDRSGLPLAVYGQWPSSAQAAALDSAAVELLTEGRLEPATGSRDATGRPRFPARPGERRIPLIGYRPVRVRITRPWGLTDPAAEPMRMQYVPGHLRRLHPKSSPSEAQRVAFRDHCRRLGKADGWELPDGYTFVTGHTRGR